MDEVDVYPVGLLLDLGTFGRTVRLHPERRRQSAACLVRWFRAGWLRRSYWNGYLAEPLTHATDWTRCGHGWTRRRALADLATHRAQLRGTS